MAKHFPLNQVRCDENPRSRLYVYSARASLLVDSGASGSFFGVATNTSGRAIITRRAPRASPRSRARPRRRRWKDPAAGPLAVPPPCHRHTRSGYTARTCHLLRTVGAVVGDHQQLELHAQRLFRVTSRSDQRVQAGPEGLLLVLRGDGEWYRRSWAESDDRLGHSARAPCVAVRTADTRRRLPLLAIRAQGLQTRAHLARRRALQVARDPCPGPLYEARVVKLVVTDRRNEERHLVCSASITELAPPCEIMARAVAEARAAAHSPAHAHTRARGVAPRRCGCIAGGDHQLHGESSAARATVSYIRGWW